MAAAGAEDLPLKPPDAEASPDGGGDDDKEEPPIPPKEEPQDEGGPQPAPSLPDDALADIFGRLAPRWIAVSRCVCRSWCGSIDARRLLPADLLPLSLRGLFVHFEMHKYPALFARPAPAGAPAVGGKLNFLPSANAGCCVWNLYETYDTRQPYVITNHCNGLLLIDKYVVNPATRRWDALPPGPPGRVQFIINHVDPVRETMDNYLVFDPTVSPHYEVLRICPLSRVGSMDDLWREDAQCPSPVCTLNVFSSRSGSWEERSFVREGGPAGTVAEVQSLPRAGAVYWRGALYVHCESHFVLRVSLSNNTYRVVSRPPGYAAHGYPSLFLQRSEKGVYFLSLENYLLRVWILKESCGGLMEWVLKHEKDLEPVLARRRPQQVHGPWMLKGINHNSFCTHFPEDNEVVEEKLEWSSDGDDVLDNEVQDCCYSNNDSGDALDAIEECRTYESSSNDGMVEEEVCEIDMLGLHPFKEILFLSESAKTGLAYHLNSSKIEGLGDVYPAHYYRGVGYGRNEMDRVKYAFPYTPCWIEEYPRNN